MTIHKATTIITQTLTTNKYRFMVSGSFGFETLPSDYITRPVALVQHCSSRGVAAEEQHRGAAGVQQQQGG